MNSTPQTNFLPLFFNLKDRRCLVVGGGIIAGRKVEQLLHCEAQVTIVSPEITEEIKKMLVPRRCEWLQRPYISPEASAYQLVIATTDDQKVNEQVFQDCSSRGVPVNVVDQPPLCTVIFPSTIRKGFITIAISSDGKVPFLTRSLRIGLQDWLDDIFQLERPEPLLEFRNFIKNQKVKMSYQTKRTLYDRLLAVSREQWLAWSESEPPLDLWQEWVNAALREQK